VEEVRTVGRDRILEDLLGTDELPDLEDEGVPEPVPKRTKPGRTARTEYR
jgi:Transposase IS4